MLLDDAGAGKVRPTKDLDIVLMIRPQADFIKVFMQYINLGGYEIQQGKKEQASFYRFQKPNDEKFPIMIELFSAVSSNQ